MARILLVDDNLDLITAVAELLCGASHAVTTAANGRKALELLEDNAYDLVITDIIMPEMEGIETIMNMRKKYPALKVVAMSGGGRISPEEYLVIARKLGVAQTLTKPFSGKELNEAVDKALSQ